MLHMEDLAARERFAALPENFWRWNWQKNSDHDMPLTTKYLMGGLARGYQRVSAGGSPEARLEAAAQTAVWYAWSRPDSHIIIPSTDQKAATEFIQNAYVQAQNSPHYFFRAEFQHLYEVPGIARSYQDFLCIVPITPRSLIESKKAALAKFPTLVLIPDFDSLSPDFIRLICGKLSLPNVKIAALHNDPKPKA